jgi:predicted amidohydrolase YtcJ
MARAIKVTDQTILLRSMVVAGIPLALGSDAGAEEQNPFLNPMLANA